MPKSPKKNTQEIEEKKNNISAKDEPAKVNAKKTLVKDEKKTTTVKEKQPKGKEKDNNQKEANKGKKTSKKETTKAEDKNKKEESNKKGPESAENKAQSGEQTEEAALIEEPVKAIKIDEIKKTIKIKKKIPTEEMYKINKVIFKNLLMAVAVITYFLFINLGYINIKNDVYIIDLKVFSMCILLLAIVLLENAYKKDNGSIAIFGIEMIVASIISVSLIYINLMLANSYIAITASISFIFAIYYLIKTIIIYLKMKKAYFVNDMKEIINPED